jgi:hypothetical protein
MQVEPKPGFRDAFRNLEPVERQVVEAIVRRDDLSALYTELAQTKGIILPDLLERMYPRFGLAGNPNESSRRFFLGRLYQEFLKTEARSDPTPGVEPSPPNTPPGDVALEPTPDPGDAKEEGKSGEPTSPAEEPAAPKPKARRRARAAKRIKREPSPEEPDSPDTSAPTESGPIVQPEAPPPWYASGRITVELSAVAPIWRVRAAGTTDTCVLAQFSIGAVAPAEEPASTAPNIHDYDAGDIRVCTRELRLQALRLARGFLLQNGEAEDGILTQSELARVAARIMTANVTSLRTFISALSPEQKRALNLWAALEAEEYAAAE